MDDTQKLERLDYLSSLPYSKHTSEDWDEELALECELDDHTFYLVIGHEINEDGEFSLVQKTFASLEKLNREKLASMFYVYHIIMMLGACRYAYREVLPKITQQSRRLIGSKCIPYW